jgi:hypothetical protein
MPKRRCRSLGTTRLLSLHLFYLAAVH